MKTCDSEIAKGSDSYITVHVCFLGHQADLGCQAETSYSAYKYAIYIMRGCIFEINVSTKIGMTAFTAKDKCITF